MVISISAFIISCIALAVALLRDNKVKITHLPPIQEPNINPVTGKKTPKVNDDDAFMARQKRK